MDLEVPELPAGDFLLVFNKEIVRKMALWAQTAPLF